MYKLLILLLSSLSLLAADPLNPPAPELLSVIRSKTHAELKISYKNEVEVFQIIRRTAVDTESFLVNPLKLKSTIANGVTTVIWKDKKLQELKYRYSVVAITETGTSLESNVLESTP